MLVQLGAELAEFVFTTGPPLFESSGDLVLPDRDLLPQNNHSLFLIQLLDCLLPLLPVFPLEETGSESSYNQ